MVKRAEKPTQRRRFTEEFKREALQLIERDGYSVAKAAERLGVAKESLYRWQREAAASGSEAFRGNGVRTSESERIRQLEREVRELRWEREILKKAARYFATQDTK